MLKIIKNKDVLDSSLKENSIITKSESVHVKYNKMLKDKLIALNIVTKGTQNSKNKKLSM